MGRIYIDTSILVGGIEEIEGSQGSREFQKIIHRLKRQSDTIIIPQIVIGESIAVIIKKTGKKWNKAVNKFIEDLQNMLKEEGEEQLPPLTKEIARHAIMLADMDYALDMCDCVIIATAIEDKEADYLYMTGRVVENQAILNYVREHNEKLTITDPRRR